jgi:hypothetical protein
MKIDAALLLKANLRLMTEFLFTKTLLFTQFVNAILNHHLFLY